MGSFQKSSGDRGRPPQTRRRGAGLFDLVAIGLLVVFPACSDFPRDPAASLDQVVERGTLRVGASDAPPFIITDSGREPAGAEAVLLAEFAAELGVSIEWQTGSTEELVEALKRNDLDVVAAGMTTRNPWTSHVGFTLPYHTAQLSVSLPPSHATDESLDGVQVFLGPHERHRHLVEAEGADPVTGTADPEDRESGVLKQSWESSAEGRTAEFPIGPSAEHVLAVPPGENALLMRLEAFLFANADSVRVVRLLREAGVP